MTKNKIRAAALLLSVIITLTPTHIYAEDVSRETSTITETESTTQEETTEEAVEDDDDYYNSKEYQMLSQYVDVVDNTSDQEMIEKEIAEAELNIKCTEDEIQATQYRLNKTKDESEKCCQDYAQMMRSLYIAGGTYTTLEILIESDSMETFFTRLQMIDSVSKETEKKLSRFNKLSLKYKQESDSLLEKKTDLIKQEEILENGLEALKSLNGMSSGSGSLLTAEDIIEGAEEGKSIITDGKFSYPTKYRRISAGFPNYSSGSYHGGIDFPCPKNTPVYAAADGVVILARNLNYSYGHYLIIDHGNGLSTLYAHNETLGVKAGDVVKRGQVIALSGSTGNSTGPHCHFEVRVNGTRVDPNIYLKPQKAGGD